MEKLKAAFGEVMQPRGNRQMEDEALVKTMKVCTYVHTYTPDIKSYYAMYLCIVCVLIEDMCFMVTLCTRRLCILLVSYWFVSADPLCPRWHKAILSVSCTVAADSQEAVCSQLRICHT